MDLRIEEPLASEADRMAIFLVEGGCARMGGFAGAGWGTIWLYMIL